MKLSNLNQVESAFINILATSLTFIMDSMGAHRRHHFSDSTLLIGQEDLEAEANNIEVNVWLRMVKTGWNKISRNKQNLVYSDTQWNKHNVEQQRADSGTKDMG